MSDQLQTTILWYRSIVEARLRGLAKDKDGEFGGGGLSLELLVLIAVGVVIAAGVGVWLGGVITTKEATIIP